MYIAKFQVKNYKSYLSSQEVDITPGFNVVVGQNNAGKTALIEALSLQFENKMHLSMKTVPSPGVHVYDSITSTTHISFQLDEEEAKQLLINARSPVYLLISGGDVTSEANKFLSLLRQRQALQCIYEQNRFVTSYLESIGDLADATRIVELRVNISQRQLEVTQNIYQRQQISPDNLYGARLANILRDRIYIFRAERLNISQSPFGNETVLHPNATNLARVLNHLQSDNPSRFRRLIQHVSTIFPEIKGITIPPAPSGGEVRILVWSIDPDTERSDLAIPLSESGTGIGQVLAMLYVVLTAEYPRTIIIDEPQSFLNPGAVRKLIAILKQYAQHQFIITTHSPEVASAANPKTLLLLGKVEAETTIELLDITNPADIWLFLSAIGSRLADVFGADNILWVEGATEEQCFPLIVEKILNHDLQGTKIVSVIQTGDFDSKHTRTILQLYQRLSRGSSLMPPAIGFIFDQEGRSQQEQEDLIRQSQGSVEFLKRRMYENYLINPDAISFVISQIEGFRESPVTLLETIFKEFSECRVEYDKVTYGLALTEWIVKNAPTDLSEVASIIASKLGLYHNCIIQMIDVIFR